MYCIIMKNASETVHQNKKGNDMSMYANLSKEQLEAEYRTARKAFEDIKAKKLELDMSRGKPCTEQLDMVSDILSVLTDPKDCFDGNIDVRNYGEFMGIPSCRKLFAEILGTKPEQIFVGGSASIYLMYDVVAKAYSHGLLHSERPWSQEEKIKILCPAPGYDNHFVISEHFGAEMITIPMTEHGPDMDKVEEEVKDPAVKAIWCVPKYSNPQGIIYSEEVISRLAHLKPAAPDFTILWDNAYCVHEIDGEYLPFPDILRLCKEAGNPDMVFEFASTSKITMPGSGVSVLAANEDNLQYITKLMSCELISYDKVNQLRHVKYLKDKEHVIDLMKKHAEILKPRFDAVVNALERELKPLGIGKWHKPKGGYFVSFEAVPGTAKRTLQLCKEAGVIMTPAGATYPYGMDPYDSNIRIAPTRPPVEELCEAMEVFCICTKIAVLEKMILEK